MEIECLQRNGMFKSQITLDRHNARPRLNYYFLPGPSHFSLPSTFKDDNQTLRHFVIYRDNNRLISISPRLNTRVVTYYFNNFLFNFSILFVKTQISEFGGYRKNLKENERHKIETVIHKHD